MSDYLDGTGLHIDDLEDRISAIVSSIRANISTTFDYNTESPQGQLIKIFAEHAQSLAELTQAVYASFSPTSANGQSLDNLCAITGTYRSPGTKSSVTATVNVDPGTYAVGSLVASVAGAPSSRFANSTEVINSGGGAANKSCTMESEELGPVQALSGTLTIIAEPTTGWNSITNAADATLGTNEESDSQLRLRRYSELVTGSTNVDAVKTALMQVPGVIWANVIDNPYNIDLTIPAHSIGCVVYGPTSTAHDIATAIFDSKAAGIGTDGALYHYVTDSMGYQHIIEYSLADEVDVYVHVTLTKIESTYDGDDAVKLAITSYASEEFGVGDSISPAKIMHAIFDRVAGVDDIVLLELGYAPSPTQTTMLSIDWNQIASFSTSNIVVTS